MQGCICEGTLIKCHHIKSHTRIELPAQNVFQPPSDHFLAEDKGDVEIRLIQIFMNSHNNGIFMR